jgi:hypothetical protein
MTLKRTEVRAPVTARVLMKSLWSPESPITCTIHYPIEIQSGGLKAQHRTALGNAQGSRESFDRALNGRPKMRHPFHGVGHWMEFRPAPRCPARLQETIDSLVERS